MPRCKIIASPLKMITQVVKGR